MGNPKHSGLGELLRHLTDVLDQGSEDAYLAMGIDYRARYTPIMRAFSGEPISVSEIQERARFTQGAISQTIKLMEADDLVDRVITEDGRSRTVQLTEKGMALHTSLLELWQHRLDAIADLEAEIGYPLRSILASAINALEQDGLAERLVRLIPKREEIAG